MRILLTVIMLLLTFSAQSFADTYVNGYTRSNGVYVAPHYRSNRDNSIGNNWSTKGNVNPYTGSRGYKTFY